MGIRIRFNNGRGPWKCGGKDSYHFSHLVTSECFAAAELSNDLQSSDWVVTFSALAPNGEELLDDASCCPIIAGKLSSRSVHKLINAVKEMQVRSCDSDLSVEEKTFLKYFSLPNPQTMPECWRIDPKGRLHILWGYCVDSKNDLVLPWIDNVSSTWNDAASRKDIRQVCKPYLRRGNYSRIGGLLLLVGIIIALFVVFSRNDNPVHDVFSGSDDPVYDIPVENKTPLEDVCPTCGKDKTDGKCPNECACGEHKANGKCPKICPRCNDHFGSDNRCSRVLRCQTHGLSYRCGTECPGCAGRGNVINKQTDRTETEDDALAYLSDGKYREAAECFRKAYNLDCGNADLWSRCHDSLFKKAFQNNDPKYLKASVLCDQIGGCFGIERRAKNLDVECPSPIGLEQKIKEQFNFFDK